MLISNWLILVGLGFLMRSRPIYSADREKNVPGGDRSPTKIIESIIVSSLNLFSFCVL
uniref:hypothetical protein n=1 Tax=Hassallia byssoidea TaxID=482630 RepID=UPI001F2C9D5C|nr:hypothetical protein [Hassalia byssoidea]